MPAKLIHALQSALTSLKCRIVSRLLGPVSRAATLVADADAALIGLYPRPSRTSARHHKPFFNQLHAITCS